MQKITKLNVGLRFCLAVIMLTCSSAAFAEDTERKMIISALSAPPYVFLDDDNQPAGILVKLLKVALKENNIEPQFLISNWARAYAHVERGEADAIIPTIKAPERERVFVYPDEPLTLLRMSFLKRSSSAFIFDGNLLSINDMRIGKIRKARVSKDFDKAVSEKILKVEERSDFEMLAIAVAKDRLDLIAGDELMAKWGAKQQGVLDQIESLSPALGEVPVYIAISKASAFAESVNEISEAIEKSRYQDDFQRYAAEYYSKLK